MASRDGLLKAHRAELERFRGSMNLVGPGPLDPHFEDATHGVAGLDARGRWADLGSGAGFPGIAFAAAYPEARVDLVESRAKRCVFLNRVLAEAGADEGVRVRNARVEDLEPGVYDGIVARAFRPPEIVLDHAARLLVPGGRAVIWLSTDQQPPAHEAFEGPTTQPHAAGDQTRVRAVWVRR